jgi:tRNA nucleotidyltransferase (CCA-adding enzyme)
MVDAGEVDALVPERVWQEFARGLMATRPSRLLEVLAQCGALPRLLPELGPHAGHPELPRGGVQARALDHAAGQQGSLPVRYACLGWPDEAGAESASVRLRVGNHCRDLARMLARERERLEAGLDGARVDAAAVLALFERCDALRRPERFLDLLQAAAAEWFGRRGEQPYPPASQLPPLLLAARATDSAAVAARTVAAGASGPAIGAAVQAARLAAVQAAADAGAGAAPEPPR